MAVQLDVRDFRLVVLDNSLAVARGARDSKSDVCGQSDAFIGDKVEKITVVGDVLSPASSPDDAERAAVYSNYPRISLGEEWHPIIFTGWVAVSDATGILTKHVDGEGQGTDIDVTLDGEDSGPVGQDARFHRRHAGGRRAIQRGDEFPIAAPRSEGMDRLDAVFPFRLERTRRWIEMAPLRAIGVPLVVMAGQSSMALPCNMSRIGPDQVSGSLAIGPRSYPWAIVMPQPNFEPWSPLNS